MYANFDDEECICKYFDAKHQLNDILLHEKLYWKQRSKTFCLEEGDSNSKFFHANANNRKKINHLPS